MRANPKIVCLGGGTGLAAVLRGLKLAGVAPTAIVTLTDDGGSSGRLRRDLGMPPPGDVRNCLVALADDGAVADEAFLTVFARHPGADEKADVAAALAGRADDRAVAIAELLWAMLASNEFRFNH